MDLYDPNPWHFALGVTAQQHLFPTFPQAELALGMVTNLQCGKLSLFLDALLA